MKREKAIEIISQVRALMTMTGDKSPKALMAQESLDMAIKALEQEPVLDNIRAEIEDKSLTIPYRRRELTDGWIEALEWVLEIIDKYKTEGDKE